MDIWLFSGHGDNFGRTVKSVGALCGCRAGYYQFVSDSRFLSYSYLMMFATEASPEIFSICPIILNSLYLYPLSCDAIPITFNEAISMNNLKRSL
jgi:hypothetical protein